MRNIGKVFEDDFKKSIPDGVLIYRLPDAAQSFGGSSKLRFSRRNPFDFLLWNPEQLRLYALELKTVKGKSISFEREIGENKEIHYHQIIGLSEWNEYDGVTCGFVINFREIEKTVFIEIEDFKTLITSITKKSFNYDDLVNSGIPYLVIDQHIKRVRYSYDVQSFFEKASSYEDRKDEEIQEVLCSNNGQ